MVDKRGDNRFIDITGQRFGRWTVLSRSTRRSVSPVMWLCRCKCGTTRVVNGNNLGQKKSTSCGCYNRDRVTTHGMSYTKEYARARTRRRWKKIGKTINPRLLMEHITELGNHCVFCHGQYEHLDHFIPLSRGGKHELSNLVPSCAHCNIIKSDKMPGVEWWPKHWETTW